MAALGISRLLKKLSFGVATAVCAATKSEAIRQLGGRPMSSREPALTPFPIQKLRNRWEVVVVHDEVVRYIPCESQKAAEAVANSRIFNTRFECRQLREVDPVKVRQCQDALAASGWQYSVIYRRMGNLLDEIAKLGSERSNSAV